MRVILIFNPTSGSSMLAADQKTPEQLEETIVTSLRKYGIEPEVWHTTQEEPGDELARKAVKEGADLIMAAGGDGTIHAVASGLIGSNKTMGIIATGTMNNLAHSLSIPSDIEEACNIIANGETSLIDVGKINGHIFLEVAGVGLEAALFPAAEEIKSYGWLSTVRGVITGLIKLFSFKPPRFKIAFDNRRGRSYHALQVTVCNSPYYGVHLQVAPRILLDDGLLDVVIYKNFKKLEYIQHAISISQGRRKLQPKIRHRKAKLLRIDADQPVEIHADGIPHGHTPAEIVIVPNALCVRIPKKVKTGPNMATPELKRTKRYQRVAESNELLDKKGAVHAE